jgi:hypothetical protein
MKFTRFFILKALTNREETSNPNNPFEVFKEVIISHPNIDFTLTLILSLLMLITKYNDDINYLYSNSINIYILTTINVVTLLYYFALEYLDHITHTTPGKNLLSIGSNNVRNSVPNVENIQESQSNSTMRIPFQIINPFNLFSLGNPKKIQLPMIIYRNWHLFKTILHLFKIISTILTYFISFIFCMIYSEHKFRIDKEKYLLLHLLLLDFYEFYSGFRVCYFLIKILINIFLMPIYISAIILGYIEDRFNEKLNKLVNTKFYSGRSSIKNPNGRVSEMEEYCSICLNSFQLQEMVSTLPCSRRHTFHTVCLEKWFLTTVTCPLCRSDFHTSMDFLVNGGVVRNNSQDNNRPFELQQNLL